MTDHDIAVHARECVEELYCKLVETGTVPIFLIAEVPDSDIVTAHVFQCSESPEGIGIIPTLRGLLHCLEKGRQRRLNDETTFFEHPKEEDHGE